MEYVLYNMFLPLKDSHIKRTITNHTKNGYKNCICIHLKYYASNEIISIIVEGIIT